MTVSLLEPEIKTFSKRYVSLKSGYRTAKMLTTCSLITSSANAMKPWVKTRLVLSSDSAIVKELTPFFFSQRLQNSVSESEPGSYACYIHWIKLSRVVLLHLNSWK